MISKEDRWAKVPNDGPRGLTETFAERLSALFEAQRTPKGGIWTNTALAAAVTELGVPSVQSHISQLRNGRRSNPSAALVGAIAAAFGVPISYFFGEGADDRQNWLNQLRTVSALREAGVESIALRSSGVSPEGMHRLIELAEYIRSVEGLPPVDPQH